MWTFLLLLATAQPSVITSSLDQNGATLNRATALTPIILRESLRWGVDPLLVTAVVSLENSSLQPQAVSTAGAIGIMQIMPLWLDSPFATCGRDLTDVQTNVCFGVRILRFYVERNIGLADALHGYNGCRKAPGCEQYAVRVLEKYVSLQHRSFLQQNASWIDQITWRATDRYWRRTSTLFVYPGTFMLRISTKDFVRHRTVRGAPCGCAPRTSRRPSNLSVIIRCCNTIQPPHFFQE